MPAFRHCPSSLAAAPSPLLRTGYVHGRERTAVQDSTADCPTTETERAVVQLADTPGNRVQTRRPRLGRLPSRHRGQRPSPGTGAASYFYYRIARSCAVRGRRKHLKAQFAAGRRPTSSPPLTFLPPQLAPFSCRDRSTWGFPTPRGVDQITVRHDDPSPGLIDSATPPYN